MFDLLDLIFDTVEFVRLVSTKEGRRELLGCLLVLVVTFGILGGVVFAIYRSQAIASAG